MDDRRSFSLNTVRICVDECEGVASGRAYSKLSSAPLEFLDPAGMLLELDQLFNYCRYPQAFQECRSFVKKKRNDELRILPARLSDAELRRKRGKYRTLDLVVQSRRCSGWQGFLMRPDRTIVLEFKSEMEFLEGFVREMEQEPLMRVERTG